MNKFINRYNDLKITDGKEIVINKEFSAKVKFLSGKSYGNFEAIAYVDAVKSGIIIVMSSRTKKGFEDSINSFNSLVQSYTYLGDKILINNN